MSFLTRFITRSIRTTPLQSKARGYATPPAHGSDKSTPGHSYTPYWIAGVALAVVGGYYSISNRNPPQIGAVDNIERAMAPKTEGANVPGETPTSGYVKRHN